MTPHFQAIRQQALETVFRFWRMEESCPQKPAKVPSAAARVDLDRLVDEKNLKTIQTPVHAGGCLKR
jgi:hypothetical protein